MATQDCDLIPALGVPNSRTIVTLSRNASRRRDDALPIWAEGSGVHVVLVPVQDRDFLVRRAVPTARRVTPQRREDALPIRAEGGGIHDGLKPAQDRDLFAGCGLPDARRFVP